MPYSERQLACLSAMGLVAWVERPPATVSERLAGAERAASVSAREPVPESAPAPASVPVHEPVHAPVAESAPALASESESSTPDDALARVDEWPMPDEPHALGMWLAARPLATFIHRERTLTRIGRDDAPLLVVVERAAPAETLPLVGEAAVLFERMLQSIGLTRRDTCQCVLADGVRVDSAASVATLAGPPHRATLVLLQHLDGALDERGCRLDTPPDEASSTDAGLPAPTWALAHPERLLAEPLGKARAWRVLKDVRRHLGMPGPGGAPSGGAPSGGVA